MKRTLVKNVSEYPLLLPGVACLLGAVAAISCSMGKDIDIARRATNQFHREMAAGDYGAIYDKAGRAYKQAMTREAHDAFMARIRRNMGRFKSSVNTGSFVNVGTSRTSVRLEYKTQCANGQLGEAFVWRVEGGRAALIRYEANSPRLLSRTKLSP